MSLLDEQPAGPVQAWSVEYAGEAPPPGKSTLAAIKRPRVAWACAQTVDAMQALADNTTPTADANGFTFIFVQSGSSAAYEVQKQAESWMAARADEQGENPRTAVSQRTPVMAARPCALFRHAGIHQRHTRAVAHFSFCEAELRKLEQKAAEVGRRWRRMSTSPTSCRGDPSDTGLTSMP